jgi:hypothetical protein
VISDQPDEVSSGLAHIVDSATDILTGASIPAPIRKNALKALGQLCSAAVDIPVAYLEGVAAEKRAESAARVKLIATSADQLAAQMKIDPRYAAAAAQKGAQRILKTQMNLDQIAISAAKELGDATEKPEAQLAAPLPEPEDIADDWLNAFEAEASQKGSDEMQQLFARILAGEIRRPSTFSIKTVKLLGQLDSRAAAHFQRLCSLSVSLRTLDSVLDARVVSLNGDAAKNSLAPFGLSFSVLNILHEYGLIIPDYNSYIDLRAAVVTGTSIGVPLTYQNFTWGLFPQTEAAPPSELRVHGVQLSRSGKELLPVVEVLPDPAYTEALQAYFQGCGFAMNSVNVRRGA